MVEKMPKEGNSLDLGSVFPELQHTLALLLIFTPPLKPLAILCLDLYSIKDDCVRGLLIDF